MKYNTTTKQQQLFKTNQLQNKKINNTTKTINHTTKSNEITTQLNQE